MAESTVESLTEVVVNLTEKVPVRVLHVDDEAGFLKAAKACLEMEGQFQVETASSVEEALEKMKKKTFDVIVTDYVMPGKDGLQFLDELREKENKIPFIMFTGKGREEVAIKALNLGADRYINKVGDPETVYGELAHSIRKAVKARQAEKALRESEEKFRNIFESASDCMIYLDRSGRILDVNKKAVEVFGGSKKELLGKHFTRLGIFSLRDIPTLMKKFANILADKKAVVNIRVKNKKGQEIPLECSASLMKTGDKFASIMVIARDITERKKVEKTLRDATEKWISLTENTDDTIMIVDNNNVIQYVNRTIPPTTPEGVIGRTVYEYVSKEHHNIMRQSLKKVYKTGEPDSYEVSLNMSAINPKLGTLWFRTKIVPIKTDKGVSGVIMIATNITGRKKAEEALKTTLEKVHVLNEKLGVVGKLTRHDTRNKLSTVTMNTYLAKQKLAGNHEALKHLSEIESACEQVERIFDFAKIYEKLGVEELTYMNVEKTLGKATILFSDLHSVKVVNDCHGLTVLADSLLRQLLYNLIDNSLKHGEKVSRIKVHYEEAGKDQLKLVYEDDGVGIPKAEKEKIFQEGYGKGTGYGLYLIKKMCEVYGWTIRETGKHGKGAQFTMTIPKMNESRKENYQLN